MFKPTDCQSRNRLIAQRIMLQNPQRVRGLIEHFKPEYADTYEMNIRGAIRELVVAARILYPKRMSEPNR